MSKEIMNKYVSFRIDNETLEILQKIQEELKITRSDIIRMSIRKFYNYVKKVNK